VVDAFSRAARTTGCELRVWRLLAPMDNLKERMALEEMHRSGKRLRAVGKRSTKSWRIMPVVEQTGVSVSGQDLI
jgi:hypothetical protein